MYLKGLTELSLEDLRARRDRLAVAAERIFLPIERALAAEAWFNIMFPSWHSYGNSL